MKENALSHLSQSMGQQYTVMQDRVNSLEKKLDEVNIILGYLAMTNAELSNDMSAIYKALKSVSDPDPYDYFSHTSEDDPDDDLLN